MKVYAILGIIAFLFIAAGLILGVRPAVEVPVFPDAAHDIQKVADGWWEFTIMDEVWYVKEDRNGNPMYIRGDVSE